MNDLYKLAVAFEKLSQDFKKDAPNMSELPKRQTLENEVQPKIDPYIQFSLNNLGYEPKIKVDGLLGPETQGALEWFKKNHNSSSKDLKSVFLQVKNEAAKLKGEKSNQIAFKVPGEVKSPIDQSSLDNSGANANGFVGNGPKPDHRLFRP